MINRNKTILFSVLALISLFAALAIPYFQKIANNEKLLVRNFNEEILVRENSLDQLLDKIYTFLVDEENPVSEIIKVKSIFDELEIFSILIYQKDSLIFWSNNSIPVTPWYAEGDFIPGMLKLSNGWYDIRKLEQKDYVIIGLIPIKYSYSYQNQYLKNQFAKIFSLPDYVEITNEQNTNEIKNSEGTVLFSLKFPDSFVLSPQAYLLISLLYFLSFMFIIASVYNAYQLISQNLKIKNWLIIAFIIDALLIRFILQYYHIPHILYDTDLFKPKLFASSYFLPSLGDLLANLIAIFAIAIAIYSNLRVKLVKAAFKNYQNYVIPFVLILYIGILFLGLYFFMNNIVLNSSFSLNLSEINSLNAYSILGLVGFALLILSFIFLTLKVSIHLISLLSTFVKYLLVVTVSVAILAFISNQLFNFPLILFAFLYIYILSFWTVFRSKSINIQFSSTLFYILLFSLFSTYLLHHANNYKEKEFRKLAAINLSTQKDPVTEYKFNELSKIINNDSLVIGWFDENSTISSEDISYYVESKYFKGFWLKYDVLITTCDTSKILDIQAEEVLVNCYDYFDAAIEEFGHHTNTHNLFYLDYNYSDDYYLGILDYSMHQIPVRIFIEMFPKSIPKGLGYPELLVDQAAGNPLNWSVYSYARYENKELAYRYGKYYYSISLPADTTFGTVFYNSEGYSHMLCKLSNTTDLIISKQQPTFIDIIAPFSYLSIFYGLMIFLLFVIIRSPINLRIAHFGFKKRLQFSVILIIVVSFLFVGIGSLFYIVSLNDNKNYSILSEKTHSVLIELEHKLAGAPFLTSDMEMYLSDYLYKFSLIFFTDINMYDLNGTLLATSRPEVFHEGLKSSKMDPIAFINLNKSTKSLYVHEEKVGEYPYLSAYIPFRNEDNKIIAYLNLPYFAKQDELTNEVSTFLVAFININVILVAIAIFIVLLVSNRILKPIQLLKEKISRLKLGKTDEKIEWSGMDEIGSLVHEYNRMVDELAESAEMLAKSERESAWREMAQQIAHEIKNPLTPMKLSVQYLQKAWNEKTDDWDRRLERFTKTIIEQIDSLSIIASEFSNFANMPRARKTKVNLVEIINNSIGLFKNTTKVRFHFENKEECLILIDRDQILRVFNNLIKNSIQAISNPEHGKIEISITRSTSMYQIRISDNGSGIPEDQQEKIFYPRFTTKTSGMGLGLAMIKGIIENSGGSISIESTEGEGTTFFINLPTAF